MAPTPEKTRIRRMTAADLTQVLEIATRLPELPRWPESAYLNALNPEATPRRIALVAFSERGRIEGFAVASQLPPEAELESIAVALGSRRQGLGRLLFDGLIDELRAAGVHEINLEVRATNQAALGFYRAAGFAQTGLRKAYYADPIEDAVLMGLRLR
jgi:ribosomal-protein-alanine N-acetyltransferase